MIFISYPCSSLVELGADMAGASFTSHIITLERLDLAIEGTNKDAVNQGLNAQKMQQWNVVLCQLLLYHLSVLSGLATGLMTAAQLHRHMRDLTFPIVNKDDQRSFSKPWPLFDSSQSWQNQWCDLYRKSGPSPKNNQDPGP